MQVLLYIIWIGNAKIVDMSESQCEQIYPDMCSIVNMPGYACNITSSKYVSIGSHKVQNMHELISSSFRNLLNMSAAVNIAE